jgi:hypothetical protein
MAIRETKLLGLKCPCRHARSSCRSSCNERFRPATPHRTSPIAKPGKRCSMLSNGPQQRPRATVVSYKKARAPKSQFLSVSVLTETTCNADQVASSNRRAYDEVWNVLYGAEAILPG